MHTLFDLDCSAFSLRPLEYGADVPSLSFDHEDLRVVAKPGIRATHDEEVRESTDSRSEVGRHSLAPCIIEVDSSSSSNGDLGQRILRVESGAENDTVGFDLLAGGGDDSIVVDLADSIRYHVDVLA